MARPFVAKIASANALLDGRVVYLAPDSSWTTDHRAALIARDPAAARALLARAQGASGGSPGAAVGAYLVEVDVGDDGAPAPRARREIIRARGPSVGAGVAAPPGRAGR